MDSRFPSWLRTFIRKFDFIGIPQLAGVVCGMAVLAYLAQMSGTVPFERFVFNPYLVLQGEWWRLFAFPISFGGGGSSNPIWVILFIWYLYFIINTLESHWGPGPTTLFIVIGYLSTLAGAFITMRPVEIWYYIIESASLAFGTLFPDFELLIYFILPVKAKWLALFAAALLLFQFVFGSMSTKILLLCGMFPYFLFFGPFWFQELRIRSKVAKNRKRFDKDMWR